MGGAHQILNSSDGTDNRTAEEKHEDFGGKERCVVMGGTAASAGSPRVGFVKDVQNM